MFNYLKSLVKGAKTEQDEYLERVLPMIKSMGVQHPREAVELIKGGHISAGDWEKIREPWERGWVRLGFDIKPYRNFNKETIEKALEYNNVTVSDNDSFHPQASKSVGKIILRELEKDGSRLTEDDIFIAGIFVMCTSNYISQLVTDEGDFEAESIPALLSFYEGYNIDHCSHIIRETIDSYNDIINQGEPGQAIGNTVSAFFENPEYENVEKMIKLHNVLRKNLISKSKLKSE